MDGFSKVRPKYLAMMAEMYGRFAGLIPYYFDSSFMYVTLSDYNSYLNEDKSPSIKDASDAMFSCSWSDDQNPTQVVADSFIEYVHSLGRVQGEQDISEMVCEEQTMSYIMETVMSFESVISNVFQDMKQQSIAVQESPKLILPN